MKKVFGIIAAIAFLIAFGIVGGVENDTITLGKGVVTLIIAMVVMTVCTKKAGAFDEENAAGREGASTTASTRAKSSI